jgi:hypothetical protein
MEADRVIDGLAESLEDGDSPSCVNSGAKNDFLE